MIEREKLPQAVRWEIADWIAEDRLPTVNRIQKKVDFKESVYTKYGKRILDIFFSFFALLFFLPINTIIAIVTYFDVGRPIFFHQERIGKNGIPFQIIKFRNMKEIKDERGELLPAHLRVTKWGRFVRKTSLDELLNFWSVLKGDMSLIGPRPLLPQYMHRYSERHLSRFKVKPGLECPPRDFRTPLRTWNDQFENDAWYVQNISFKTDIIQMVNLVRFVFNKKSSSERSSASRGDFMGYDLNGKAINLQEVPQEYIDKALRKMNVEEKTNG